MTQRPENLYFGSLQEYQLILITFFFSFLRTTTGIFAQSPKYPFLALKPANLPEHSIVVRRACFWFIFFSLLFIKSKIVVNFFFGHFYGVLNPIKIFLSQAYLYMDIKTRKQTLKQTNNLTNKNTYSCRQVRMITPIHIHTNTWTHTHSQTHTHTHTYTHTSSVSMGNGNMFSSKVS